VKDVVARHYGEYAKKVNNGEELELPNVAEWSYTLESAIGPLHIVHMRHYVHVHFGGRPPDFAN